MVNQMALKLNAQKVSAEIVRDTLIKRIDQLTTELETTAKQIQQMTSEIEYIEDQIEAIPPAEEKKE